MKFNKPVGATADLREIEYLSALHQTCKNLRSDGSINSSDVTKFLMSRYGIDTSSDEGLETIFRDFGGGGLSEEDGDTLDLTELLAIIIIPELLKAEMSLHRDYLELESIRNGGVLTNLRYNSLVHEIKSGRIHTWKDSQTGSIKRKLRGEPRWPDCDLIQQILTMILTDVTGDDTPKPMTKELLKRIFIFYKEHDIAENDQLLEEMISVASNIGQKEQIIDDEDEENGVVNNNETLMLDKFTFAHCLTDDVRRYNVENENKSSTNYSDVFHSSSKEYDECNTVKTVWTAAAIDYAVDTFRTKSYVVLLWMNWAIFFFIYMAGEAGQPYLSCSEDVTTAKGFGCQVAQGIVNWLIIMAKLVIFGSGSVMLCSMGYSTSLTSPMLIIMSILGMGCVVLFTFIPATLEGKFLESGEGGAIINTEHPEEEETIADSFLRYTMMVFGAILILLSVQNLLDRLIPKHWIEDKSILKQIFSGGGNVAMEGYMKQAAAYKINHMIRNAMAIHKEADFEYGGDSQTESSYGRALLYFLKKTDEHEEVGGFFWAWKRLLTKKLFTEEGIWLNTRMIQGNFGQLFLCLWLIPFFFVVVDLVVEFYDLYLIQLFEVVPSRWRVILPLALAFISAEFNALKLTTSYTPSSIRTTMRYRYGVIGSLHDPEFQKVRTMVDEASLIFGAMLWGCAYSSVLILLFSFVIFGILCFEPFAPAFIQIFAAMLGIGITIVLKIIFLSFARRRFHQRAYYRSSPSGANIIGCILEAWSLGISTLYILKRMVFLLSAAFIFVGRIDIPFLGEDADQLGPWTLDRFPFIFRKDILTHEAHRHPYIERIGVMYMMKLKHGKAFGSLAGMSWRILFVYTLMPWLRKYRIRSGGDINVANFKFSSCSAIFKRYESAKATLGLSGRIPLTAVEESRDTKDIVGASIVDRSNEPDESVLVDELKKEIERLKAEVDKLQAGKESGKQ